MKFFLDENEDEKVLTPVRVAFKGHEFLSAAEAGLRKFQDLQLFEKLAERGFSGIITFDRAQMKDPDERSKLRETNLHWIGHRQPKGRGPVITATTAATFLASFPHILPVMAKGAPPTAFHVRNIESEASQRVKMCPI